MTSAQPGPNMAEIQKYLAESLQMRINQLKQNAATMAPFGTNRMQQSTRNFVRERSPSPSGRTGRQHRSGRTDHRTNLSGSSWRADGPGLECVNPPFFNRLLHFGPMCSRTENLTAYGIVSQIFVQLLTRHNQGSDHLNEREKITSFGASLSQIIHEGNTYFILGIFIKLYLSRISRKKLASIAPFLFTKVNI